MSSIKLNPFFLLVLSLVLVLVGEQLFSDGMFFDGVIYADVAKNLANGDGTFWFLSFTDTCYPAFHEHPPLAIGMEALFFKMLGNGMLTERLYSFFTFLVTGLLLFLVWNAVTEGKYRQYFWLPLLLWGTTETVYWSFANNMLENTMGMFVASSFLFILLSYKRNKRWLLVPAGLMLTFALLSKGFTSLYPLGAIFLYWIIVRKISFWRMLIDSLIVLISLSLCLALIVTVWNDASTSLLIYLNKQVLNSIENVRTVESRFFIVGEMLKKMIPMLAVFVLVSVIAVARKVWSRDFRFNKEALWMIAVGLSGVLPVMVSLKQRGFYIMTTYFFFALAFAVLVLPYIVKWLGRVDRNAPGYSVSAFSGVILLGLSVVFLSYQPKRIGTNKDKLPDVYKICEIVPKGETIQVCRSMWQDWTLQAYLHRIGNISVEDVIPKEFVLLDEHCLSETDTAALQKIDADLERFHLFQRQ